MRNQTAIQSAMHAFARKIGAGPSSRWRVRSSGGQFTCKSLADAIDRIQREVDGGQMPVSLSEMPT